MVWYSHLFQNFPQFVVIYTVKDFGVTNKAEVDVFLEFSCFFDDPAYVDNLIYHVVQVGSFFIAFLSKCSIHLTECGPLEKGMANHFSILALKTP